MFAKLMLVLAIPGLLLFSAPSPEDFHAIQNQLQDISEPIDSLNKESLSFDELMSVIDCIDNPAIACRLTDDQVDRIASLMTLLAQKGILTPNDELENLIVYDSHQLLCHDHSQFAFASAFCPSGYKHYRPDRARGYEITPCGWISKKWKRTRSFVRKHKTVIIIGAAVIVTAAVAGIAIGAAASAKAVAAGTAAGATHCCVSNQNSTDLESTDYATPIAPTSLAPSHVSSVSNDQSVTVQQIETSFKAQLAEHLPHDIWVSPEATSPERLQDLKESVSYYGSNFAHKIVDDISEYAIVWPQLADSVVAAADTHVLNNKDSTADLGAEVWAENLITTCHEKIDRAFGTEQAELFTKEAKLAQQEYKDALGVPEMQNCVLPPPTSVMKLSTSICKNSPKVIKALIQASRAPDRAGLTKVGRSLAKHGGRLGSIFPKPKGTPQQINAQADKILKNILKHPKKIIITDTFERYGEVIDIHTPNIGGVRYHADGKFIGFLEPK